MVSSFPAFPTTAGNRSRIRQLALALQRLGHDVTFVVLGSPHEACDDAAHVAAFGAGHFHRIDKRHALRKWVRGAIPGAAKRVLRRIGVECAYYSPLDRFRDADFLRALGQLRLAPDVVLVEYVLDSWVFDAFPRSARRVLDTHDAFANRHRDYVARGIADYWVSLRPQAENAGFRRADVVLAIQDEEAQRFREQLAADACARAADPHVAVVGHLLEVGELVEEGEDGKAVFLASDNAANRDALQWLLADILPRVVRELPSFTLELGGSICRVAPDLPHVRKLGWLDDPQAALRRAALALNPMRVGTGINIKLLDAMAAGVPSVATATGARGIPDTMRAGLSVVDDGDGDGFAAAVLRFARDPVQRRAAGNAAREMAARWNAAHVATLQGCLRAG
nr:glycosyltransferase family 4 protein [Ramlibacter algicola]